MVGEKLAEFFFPGTFTHLNDYIDAERGHWRKAAKIKEAETNAIYYECFGKLPVTEYPVHIHWFWRLKNDNVDPDNIAFAKKFILDGMVLGRVLEGDSWKFIRGFADDFEVKPGDVGVVVVVYKFEEK